MKELDTLYDICDVVTQKLDRYNEKLSKNGGEMSASDLEIIDKLTHTLKSVKTTIAMIEAEDKGYSGTYWDGKQYYDGQQSMEGMSNRQSNRGQSGARGRGSRAKRDSMGRYSRDGYSREDAKEDMMNDLYELMENAPDDHTRKKLERFINELK